MFSYSSFLHTLLFLPMLAKPEDQKSDCSLEVSLKVILLVFSTNLLEKIVLLGFYNPLLVKQRAVSCVCCNEVISAVGQQVAAFQ